MDLRFGGDGHAGSRLLVVVSHLARLRDLYPPVRALLSLLHDGKSEKKLSSYHLAKSDIPRVTHFIKYENKKSKIFLY